MKVIYSLLLGALVANIGCRAHTDSSQEQIAYESRNGYLSRRRHHLPVYGDKSTRKRRQFTYPTTYTYPTYTYSDTTSTSTNPFSNVATTGTTTYTSTTNPYTTTYNPTTAATTNTNTFGTTAAAGVTSTTSTTTGSSQVSVSGSQDDTTSRPGVGVSDGAVVGTGGSAADVPVSSVVDAPVAGISMAEALGGPSSESSMSSPGTAASNRVSDIDKILIDAYLEKNSAALLAPGASIGTQDLIAPCGVQMRIDQDLTITIDNTTIFSAGSQALCPNKCKMTMKYDGELVMYALHRGGTQEQVWSANTEGDGSYGILFPDGNFVVLSTDGKVLFKSTNSPPTTNDACVLRENTITSKMLPR
ncbi:hypothetical protein SARC_09605 [Sphaeroforma arctica JP610]|uniref:Bulb-type lectin domain-containing protein n=1 Tax=Sphaeroforma arctica JP610 TaxID=667725 RepID=A0A0L0FPP7_9EUKA|nr:hypothetical protein SARC_09605 [Sphaeroforma arctica JP610]KNC77948.1 hypothetical protein SARC_09605 [Sphaeroforma arctica JP610]|eukprot:XP_014151850.1 hypothetical protein SARC_09605 [Sphaeroforma arctica JP610]